MKIFDKVDNYLIVYQDENKDFWGLDLDVAKLATYKEAQDMASERGGQLPPIDVASAMAKARKYIASLIGGIFHHSIAIWLAEGSNVLRVASNNRESRDPNGANLATVVKKIGG